jgi:hypothetical protein
MTDTTVAPAEAKSISILQPTSCISWVVLKRLMHSLYSGESNNAVPPAFLKWIASIESIRLLFHRGGNDDPIATVRSCFTPTNNQQTDY